MEYPAVLTSANDGSGYDVVADKASLAKLGGDANRLVDLLQEQGVLKA